MKKYFLSFLILFISFSNFLFGFDWPQDEIDKGAFASYFGQERGNIINKSLVFQFPQPIKAVETGKIVAIISEENDESVFFPSTLGNAVFLYHTDNLVSVYGNLDSESLTDITQKTLAAGENFANSGNSAWQENQNGLELEILDIKNKTVINPKILMTHSDSEIPLELKNITLRNKNGDFFDLNYVKNLQSGIYKVYCKKNQIVTPFRTSVSINGIETDAIYFDTILMEKDRVCVNGQKNKYSNEDMYPDNEKQLLGEVSLTPGRSTLSISVKDILGNTKSLNINLSAW